MIFNYTKSFFVSFGRTYTIHGTPIVECDKFKDLGVTVDTSLIFKSHIRTNIPKALAKLGLIYKVFRNKSKKNIVRSFKDFVRPTLDYASIVWNPHLVGSIDSLERVQQRICLSFLVFVIYPAVGVSNLLICFLSKPVDFVSSSSLCI